MTNDTTQRPGAPLSRRAILLTVAAVIAVGLIIAAVVFGLAQQEPSAGVANAGGPTASPGSATARPDLATSEPDLATTDPEEGDGIFPLVAYQGAEVLGAEEFDFTELLGTGTPVVLNFWAADCPPCRAEMPAFQETYDTYGDDFLLIGVDIGPFLQLGTRDGAMALLEDLEITYPTAYALDERAVREYGVVGMPTTIFYDGDGVESSRQVGLLSEDMLRARIQDLIGLSA